MTYNGIRDEYVAQHHHSLDEIVADLRRRQAEHPERIDDANRQRKLAGKNKNGKERQMGPVVFEEPWRRKQLDNQ